MTRITTLASLFVVGLLVALPVSAGGGVAYPLLDGRCDEYERLETIDHELPHGIHLFLFQDADYVWLCYSLPPESYGTLDLVIEAPALADPINLHVSAQLGEWRASHPDEAPTTPASDIWWRTDGWRSNPVRINGTEETPDGPRPRFLPDPGREMQLSKNRFGRGEWMMRFEIRNVNAGDEQVTVRFPVAVDDEPRSLPFMAR